MVKTYAEFVITVEQEYKRYKLFAQDYPLSSLAVAFYRLYSRLHEDISFCNTPKEMLEVINATNKYQDIRNDDEQDVRTEFSMLCKRLQKLTAKENSTMYVQNKYGKMFHFDTVLTEMDETICDEVNFALGYCEPQEFFDEYCAMHEAKYGEEFAA